MSIRSKQLAHGPGWRVEDILCSAGPRDLPFEEQHDSSCIAAVLDGSFRYRSSAGSAPMAPGALLLGDTGHAFECSHDHQCGDRCLSFHFTPAFLEAIASGVKGAHGLRFKRPRLAPSHALPPLIARIDTAGRRADALALEELAVELAGSVYVALTDQVDGVRAPSARDERRIAAVLQLIETCPAGEGRLTELAQQAAMSPYHFLRVFQQVVGMSPRQYLLRARLQRAAVQLRTSPHSISHIALECGFGDLSSFQRMFKRGFAMSPRTYRRAAPSSRDSE